MSGLDDFLANLGFGTSAATTAGQNDVSSAQSDYAGLQTPNLSPVSYTGPASANAAEASQAGPSAMGGISVNPEYNAEQEAQMTALSNLAANGGKNAASEANLAEIQQKENANAAGQRGAIMQNANARGMGGSGASLLAQLSSSQNATNNQSAEDQAVAGQEANTALNAGSGAAAIGSNMENTAFGQQAAQAQAQDAVNKFNAGENTQASEFNSAQEQGVNNAAANAYNNAATMNDYTEPQQSYEDAYQKAGGQASTALAGTGFEQNQANMGAQQAGNLVGAAVKGGAAYANSATGGEVPGAPAVPGDSTLNDFVPINTSPGEVVVPRSIAKGGTSKDISSFVKNPPKIKPTAPASGDKEAMLSALNNIRRRQAA